MDLYEKTIEAMADSMRTDSDPNELKEILQGFYRKRTVEILIKIDEQENLLSDLHIKVGGTD